MALHQDAFGPLDRRAARDRALQLSHGVAQLVQLREPADCDLERALHVLLVHGLRVGDDAALGCAGDEVGVLRVEQRDDRAAPDVGRAPRSGRARARRLRGASPSRHLARPRRSTPAAPSARRRACDDFMAERRSGRRRRRRAPACPRRRRASAGPPWRRATSGSVAKSPPRPVASLRAAAQAETPARAQRIARMTERASLAG